MNTGAIISVIGFFAPSPDAISSRTGAAEPGDSGSRAGMMVVTIQDEEAGLLILRLAVTSACQVPGAAANAALF